MQTLINKMGKNGIFYFAIVEGHLPKCVFGNILKKNKKFLERLKIIDFLIVYP